MKVWWLGIWLVGFAALAACSGPSSEQDATAGKPNAAAPVQEPAPAVAPQVAAVPPADAGNQDEQGAAAAEGDGAHVQVAGTASGGVDDSAHEVPSDDRLDEGLRLAQTHGCLACHSVDRRVVGPAWQDVAQRYAADPQAREQLIAKVSKGGRGNWSELTGGVPMPPYSPRVPDKDIAALVDFVLSLAE